jgi:hypothetical protein
MVYNDSTVVLEDMQIVFRNFAGKEDMYNREGDRNFAVLLDPPLAEQMAKDGWNVKHLKAREEGDQPQAYLSIAVSYKIRPPRVVLITSKGRNTLSEDLVMAADWVDIEFVDLTIRPYSWSVSGNSGIKAYLQSIFIKVHEDPLEIKYAHLQEIGTGELLAIEADEYVDAEIISEDEPRAIGQ